MPAPVETKGKEAPQLRTVLAAALNLREAPSPQAPILGSLPGGSKVTVTGEEGNWLQVQSEAGEKGWVSARFLSGA